jgi:hypothetical protein
VYVGVCVCVEVTELLPNILNQLGADNLKRLAQNMPAGFDKNIEEEDEGDEEGVPDLVGDFDEPSKDES